MKPTSKYTPIASFCLLTSTLFAASAPPVHAQTTNETDRAFLAQYIVDLQYANSDVKPSYGAIRNFTEPAVYAQDGTAYYRVVPYNANLAVLGLLTTKNPNRLTVAKLWMDWFFGHVNQVHGPAGAPYDHLYRADGSGETVTIFGQNNITIDKANDATDSAIATFFSVLQESYKAGVPKSFFDTPQRKAQINYLIATLINLRDPKDGLYYAKTDYRVKFLEDNCEVAKGIEDMAAFQKAVPTRNTDFASLALDLKKKIVAQFYIPAKKLYYTSKSESGLLATPDPTEWYPSMQAQLWPQLQGVVPPKDSKSLAVVTTLNNIWDGSPKPSWYRTPGQIDQGFVNASVAYAVYLTGDAQRTPLYLQAVKKLKYPNPATNKVIPGPFVVSDAGWLVRILGQVQPPANAPSPSASES